MPRLAQRLPWLICTADRERLQALPERLQDASTAIDRKGIDEGEMHGQLSTATQNLKPERRHLTADLIAGLTFAVVNVPQAMAHALLATVNPVFGIYTLMVAVPIGAIFTSSVYMNVSTTGALSVAAGAGLAGIPASQRLEALAVLVLLVGVIQLLAGLFRLGFLIRFVSNAVMTGFLNGVAVLIILGQLGDLTGFRSAFSNNVVQVPGSHAEPRPDQRPDDDHRRADAGRLIVLLLATPLRKFAFIIAIVVATAPAGVLTLPALATAASFGTVADGGRCCHDSPFVAQPGASCSRP